MYSHMQRCRDVIIAQVKRRLAIEGPEFPIGIGPVHLANIAPLEEPPCKLSLKIPPRAASRPVEEGTSSTSKESNAYFVYRSYDSN